MVWWVPHSTTTHLTSAQFLADEFSPHICTPCRMAHAGLPCLACEAPMTDLSVVTTWPHYVTACRLFVCSIGTAASSVPVDIKAFESLFCLSADERAEAAANRRPAAKAKDKRPSAVSIVGCRRDGAEGLQPSPFPSHMHTPIYSHTRTHVPYAPSHTHT